MKVNTSTTMGTKDQVLTYTTIRQPWTTELGHHRMLTRSEKQFLEFQSYVAMYILYLQILISAMLYVTRFAKKGSSTHIQLCELERS